MKKLLFTSTLATALILGACSSEESSAESSDSSAEVEELQEQITQLEEENASLQEQLDNTSTAVDEESDDSSGEDELADSGNDSSRNNPLPLGESADVKVVTYDDEGESLNGKANVTVDNVIRGQEALDAVQMEYLEIEPPAEEG